MNNLIEFYQQNLFFNLNIDQISKLTYYFKKEKFNKNNIIFRQNQNYDSLYIIKKGIV